MLKRVVIEAKVARAPSKADCTFLDRFQTVLTAEIRLNTTNRMTTKIDMETSNSTRVNARPCLCTGFSLLKVVWNEWKRFEDCQRVRRDVPTAPSINITGPCGPAPC